MERNQILKIYGTDYLQMTKEILEESRLAEMVEEKANELGKSKEELQIGMKPNLVAPSEAFWGGTTHPGTWIYQNGHAGRLLGGG